MIHLMRPDFKMLSQVSIDLTEPRHGVEVITDKNNHIVWVNVDGICVLRICRISTLVTECIGENHVISGN